MKINEIHFEITYHNIIYFYYDRMSKPLKKTIFDHFNDVQIYSFQYI